MVTMLKMQDAQHFIDSVAKHIPSTDREDIHIEGLVYNMSQEAVLKRLENILGAVDYRRLIRQFMEETDGDFVITLRLRNGKTVVFNDKWGRIPTYYTLQADGFKCSTDLPFLVRSQVNPTINKVALTELLSIGQTLGKRTLINGISYLLPSSAIISDGIDTEVEQLIPINFEEPKETLSRGECITHCKDLLLESVQARASLLTSLGYKLYADLSGGRDTRAVFSALNLLGFNPTPVTIGFCEESKVAAEIANMYGAPMLATPKPNTDGFAPALVFEDSCIVDYYTVQLVYGERAFRQKIVNGQVAANFMGLGGEFIRHPYRIPKQYSSVESAIDDGLIRHYFTIKDACTMTGFDYEEFKEHLKAHFAEYREQEMPGKTRHMYFEYYNREVNAAEHRMRAVHWTVCPLWGKKLFDFEMSVIPDKFIDDTFFCDMIKSIDLRLAEIPFHAPPVNIHRNDGLQRFLYRKLIKNQPKVRKVKVCNELRAPIVAELLKTNHCGILSDSGIEKVLEKQSHSIWHQRQLMAVILYLQELQNGTKRENSSQEKAFTNVACCSKS